MLYYKFNGSASVIIESVVI